MFSAVHKPMPRPGSVSDVSFYIFTSFPSALKIQEGVGVVNFDILPSRIFEISVTSRSLEVYLFFSPPIYSFRYMVMPHDSFKKRKTATRGQEKVGCA